MCMYEGRKKFLMQKSIKEFYISTPYFHTQHILCHFLYFLPLETDVAASQIRSDFFLSVGAHFT